MDIEQIKKNIPNMNINELADLTDRIHSHVTEVSDRYKKWESDMRELTLMVKQALKSNQ